ncbi:MAG: sporulation protein YabP [Clostridia bacterium]|nr:sporulation protein YabP [Clostridia bacterium]
MIDNKTLKQNTHNIIMESRNKISMSGINKVENFDENEIILITELGELTIKGSDLHISKMDVDIGDMIIDGNIIGLIYNETQKSNSIIKRIFR